MPQFNRLTNASVCDKVVLIRQDLNVPFQQGRISDDTRLRRALPTLEFLARQNPHALVIMSHFGRPKGTPQAAMSLKPVAQALSQLLQKPVTFAADCIGPPVKEAVRKGGLIVLENLRFHPGETSNDPGFAAQLAAAGDLYVNDAFSVSHRAHASVPAITAYLPAFAGLLLQEELSSLESLLTDPARPLAALVGGSKISTKLDLLHNLADRADQLVIGGGMANTFFGGARI